jgi:hypothetical protein
MIGLASLAATIICVVLIRSAAKHVESPPFPDELVRITAEKIPMNARLATLCFNPASAVGPHAGAAEVHIYANEIAIQYRRKHP